MTNHELPEERALRLRAMQLQRCQEQEFDAETLALLRVARRKAVATANRRQRPRFVPAAATAMATAAALVAVLIWQGVLTPVPMSPQPRPDMSGFEFVNFEGEAGGFVVPPFETREPAVLELLLSEDSWELYRDLDFYSSLAELDELDETEELLEDLEEPGNG